MRCSATRCGELLRRTLPLVLAVLLGPLLSPSANAATGSASVQQAWKQVQAAADAHDAKRFDKALQALIMVRDGEGIRNLEGVANTLNHWAQQALRQGDLPGAEQYTHAAVAVAPDAPEGYLLRSRVYWEEGSIPFGLSWFLRGSMVGMAHHWVGTAWLGYLAVVLWLSAATTLLLLLVHSLGESVKVFHHLSLEYSGFRVPTWLILPGLIAALAIPLAGPWAIGWGVVAWTLMSWLGDVARHRRMQMLLLIGVLLGPWIISPLLALTTYHSGPVEVALAESQGGFPLPGEDGATGSGKAALQKNWRVAFALGNKALRAGRYKEAIRYYQEAQGQGGDPVRLLHNTATAYYRAGNYKEAERIFQDLAQREKPTVETLFNLAQVQYQRFDFDDARTNADRAREIDPDAYTRIDGMTSVYGDKLYVVPVGFSSNDARLVMLSGGEGWAQFSAPLWRLLFGNVPVYVAPVVLLLLFLMSSLLPKAFAGRHVYECDVCKSSTCQDCIRFDYDLHLCAACSERIGRADDPKTEMASLGRHSAAFGTALWRILRRFLPGVVDLAHGRYGAACMHLLVVTFVLWWAVLLGTIPQWALSVDVGGWQPARMMAGMFLLVYVLMVFALSFRKGLRRPTPAWVSAVGEEAG